MSTRQIPPQLQWMRVVVVTCTPRGSFVCHLCNCNNNLHCKQVAVTAYTTRGLCLSVLRLTANVNGECKCRSLHVRPVASSTCPLPIPKRTCSGCGTIQAMGSLCLTKSMQVSSHVVCSQFHKEFAVDVGCYHCLYDQGPEPPMSVVQLKENFNSECQCHRMYDPWLFRSLLYKSGGCHCMYAPWMYDPWLFRLSPLQLKKYLQCKQVAVHRLLWHCMYDPWALFDCTSMKANVNGECTCWSLHVRPMASFNCLLSNSGALTSGTDSRSFFSAKCASIDLIMWYRDPIKPARRARSLRARRREIKGRWCESAAGLGRAAAALRDCTRLSCTN